MKKMCLVFSTGRCGTAFLCQRFSGEKWTRQNKSILHHKNGVVTTHERGFGIGKIIPELKKNKFGSIQSINTQKKFIDDMINSVNKEYPQTETFFISHMSIGRYISHYMSIIPNIDYRILYIERDMDDVVKSYRARLDDGKKIGRLWNIILNDPFEPSAINKISKEKWSSISFKEQMEWFWKETKDQRINLNSVLDSSKIMDVDFKTMFTDKSSSDISDFLGIPYYRMDDKVNIRDKSK